MEDLMAYLVEYLRKNNLLEGIFAVGVAILVLGYKIYQVISSNSRSNSLSDDQDSFRKDLIDQLAVLRKEIEELSGKNEELSDKVFKGDTQLRTIRLNLQVFKIIMRSTTNDPNLLTLFDNIANFNVLSTDVSLRHLGVTRSLSLSATSPVVNSGRNTNGANPSNPNQQEPMD